MKSSGSLDGMVVAISGGGRGIGAATADLLEERGARVAVGDIDAGDAAGERERRVRFLDVTDRDSFDAFLSGVTKDLGAVDVLVNNAGMMPIRRFGKGGDRLTAATLEVNLTGVVHGMELALERMLMRRRGQIVNVASLAGMVGLPGGAVYSAAKHGVVGLTESVRSEIHGSGVDLTLVLPGPVATTLTSGIPHQPGMKPVPPTLVAQRIVGAVERPRPRVYVPRRARGYALAGAVAPGLTARLARAVMRANSTTELLEPDRIGYETELDALADRVGSGADG